MAYAAVADSSNAKPPIARYVGPTFSFETQNHQRPTVAVMSACLPGLCRCGFTLLTNWGGLTRRTRRVFLGHVFDEIAALWGVGVRRSRQPDLARGFEDPVDVPVAAVTIDLSTAFKASPRSAFSDIESKAQAHRFCCR